MRESATLWGYKIDLFFEIEDGLWTFEVFAPAPAVGLLWVGEKRKSDSSHPDCKVLWIRKGGAKADLRFPLQLGIRFSELDGHPCRPCPWLERIRDFWALVAASNHAADSRAEASLAAVGRVQAAWRAFACRRHRRREAAERKLRLGIVKAATTIQSWWRGAACRRHLKLELAEEARLQGLRRLQAAVLRLQLAFRLRRPRRERRWRASRNRDGSQLSMPYDAILAFESLAEFLSTGRMDILQKAESKLQVTTEARYRVVAVVGLFDKGKTFLINKLFGVTLPSGKLHTTKGLSFLWIEERRMLVLDSAGVQSTVSYRAQAVDAILDAQTTESLMFEMISRIAHHMIFVVNDLTWFEQKYVAMLHQKYVQCKQHKELIVVHNLRNTMEVEEATKLFKRQVMQRYDGEPSHLGQLIFTADAGEGAPPVHHIGFCYEFSAAGDAFNSTNREYLLQSLEHGNILGSKVILTGILCNELSRLLPRFVNIEAADSAAPETSPSTEQAVSVDFAAASQLERVHGYRRLGTICLRLSQKGARVAMKTRGVISPLGEIIAHDVSFDPIVNVFDRTRDGTILRYIRIECPAVRGGGGHRVGGARKRREDWHRQEAAHRRARRAARAAHPPAPRHLGARLPFRGRGWALRAV